MQLPRTTARLALVVTGVLGTAGAVAVGTAAAGGDDDPVPVRTTSSDDGPGDISGPCDEAEHAGDPECAGVVVPGGATTAPSTSAPAPVPTGGGGATIPTPGGTVTYTHDGSSLHLGSAVPAAGWAVEVEQTSGREVELDFRSGSRRVQVNVELEDGRPRERVRIRDDAADTDVRIEDGTVGHDDDSGSGSRHSSGPDDD